LVVLSGYAKLVGPLTLCAFEGRILNVHPAALPRFGGQGMNGMAVHEAVLAAGIAESAVTIHHINEQYDEGRSSPVMR
jgi:phosphoribosylglycinamide formyltransferase-1